MSRASGELVENGYTTDSDLRLKVRLTDSSGADVGVTTTSNSEGTPGSATPAKSTVVAGSDGTNTRTLKTDTAGALSTPSTATAVAGAGTVTVTTSSAQFVASTATRKGLLITNNSANDVSLGLGATAVANTGIVLKANGGSWDGLISGVLWTGEVRAIAGASSAVGYVEV